MIHPARNFILDGHAAFAAVESGAHEAATGLNSRPEPTAGQKLAGNYKMGAFSLHGLPIRIENVRNSHRSGVGEGGKAWSSRMAAHYGYIAGTCGADGDGVDVFVGQFPESEGVWVVNQRGANGFDEHKVMLGFHAEQQARDAYLDSYERGWRGLASIVQVSLPQLKWWLKNGDMSRPVTAEKLPQEGKSIMDKVLWNSNVEPTTQTLPQIMYAMRVEDAKDGLMLDAVTMQELMTHPDIEGVLALDALVVQVARMTMKMNMLQKVMESASGEVKPTSYMISDPVRARGVLQVMVLFQMSDGQTVSIWLHNPDTTPGKLTPMDELISWKWMLNKKDVTIVVAPERGKDLNVREVSRRVMRLVERNSEAFQRANSKAAEHAAEEKSIDDQIVTLSAELTGLQRQIEVAKVVNESVDSKNIKANDEGEPVVVTLTGVELGEFEDTAEGKKALRAAAEKVLTSMQGDEPEYVDDDSDVNESVNPVDVAYKFDDATDVFKEYVADSVEDADYSPFASAKAMDMRAKELGMSISWDVVMQALDSVSDDEFDPVEEFEAMPMNEGVVLDGDFQGHPFRGNQFKAASEHSGAAVHASMRARHAESKGDHKATAEAYKTAHYAHKAAAVSAKGSAKKYHEKMAKFHAGRSSTPALDSATEMYQIAEGKIKKGGSVIGRAQIGGDGKSMVFIGESGTDRVKFVSKVDGKQYDAMWTEDSAASLIDMLAHPPKPGAVEPDPTLSNEVDFNAQKEGLGIDFYERTPGAIGATVSKDGKRATLEQRKAGASWSITMIGEDNPRSASNQNYMALLDWFSELPSAEELSAKEEDKPVEDQNPELVAAGKAKAEDITFLNSLIDGTADIFDETIITRLELMFESYSADDDMMRMLNQAAEAYTAATIKAAQATQGV